MTMCFNISNSQREATHVHTDAYLQQELLGNNRDTQSRGLQSEEHTLRAQKELQRVITPTKGV